MCSLADVVVFFIVLVLLDFDFSTFDFGSESSVSVVVRRFNNEIDWILSEWRFSFLFSFFPD